jgi:SAM-dependent methyltransferase
VAPEHGETPAYEPGTFWANLLDADESIRAVGHTGRPAAFNRYLYRALDDSVRRLLKDVPVQGDVFDVGVGTGVWLELWRTLGAERLAGVDLTEAAVERARRRFPDGEFVQADVAAGLPLARTFDLVSAMNVLLHVVEEERWEAALRNLAGALKPDGVLVVMDPVAVRPPRVPAHTPASTDRVRTLARWEEGLGAAGLRIDDMAPVVSLLANPVEAPSPGAYRALDRLWFASARLAGQSGAGAGTLGALLYPLDRLVTRLSRYGLSAKCLVVRKAAS